MQNRECIVFERTRDTEQRIYELGECGQKVFQKQGHLLLQ